VATLRDSFKGFLRHLLVYPQVALVFATDIGLEFLPKNKYVSVDGTFDLVEHGLVLTLLIGYKQDVPSLLVTIWLIKGLTTRIWIFTVYVSSFTHFSSLSLIYMLRCWIEKHTIIFDRQDVLWTLR
jgi:hypothetical protein